jgi:uncharacterized protein
VTLILDSSGVLPAIDADPHFHQAVREALERAGGPLILSPFVLAKLDYMILARYGPSAELVLLGEARPTVWAPVTRALVA